MSFNDGIQKFKQTTDRTAVKAVEGVAVDALQELVDNTPQDEGTAAANWNLDSREVHDFEPSRKSPEAQVQRQKANARRVATAAVRNGAPIILSNPTPYIFELDRGNSSKAPAGIMSTTIVRLRARR